MDEFLIDKKQVRRAFSRAARDYDAAAVLQREVCQRMLERLDYIKLQPGRILDAGSGTGWGTRQLAQRYPAAQVVALDTRRMTYFPPGNCTLLSLTILVHLATSALM